MASWTMAQLERARFASSTEGDVLGARDRQLPMLALTARGGAFAVDGSRVGAGAETTTSLIGNAIGLLAERPILQDELRADPAKVAIFVEEVLRFESPFRYHPRTAARSARVWAASRSSEGARDVALERGQSRRGRVRHPDEIMLDRHNPHSHFGFGRGIHHCVGAPLARLEARVVLTTLLERTKWFALDPDRPQRWADSVWIRRHEHLPVVLEPS